MKKDRVASAKVSDRLGLGDLPEISDLLLRNEPFRVIRVTGRSMYPSLRKGDRIVVEPVRPEELQLGDLILFHRLGELVCHRVVAFNDTSWPGLTITTKGDAVGDWDSPIRGDQVLGKVVAVRRGKFRDGLLAVWVGRSIEWLASRVTHTLGYLQSLRAYRRAMRSVCFRAFTYYLGLPAGRCWYSYWRIPRRGSLPLRGGDQHFHIIAKLGRICVGSAHIEAGIDGCRLNSLYVRRRYRGLGVGSQLLAMASRLAVVCEAGRLVARVEPGNTVALSLFDKLGFRPASTAAASTTSILVRQLPTLDGSMEQPQLVASDPACSIASRGWSGTL